MGGMDLTSNWTQDEAGEFRFWWTCRFKYQSRDEAIGAWSAPLAICLDALKAVGYTESKEDE